MPPALKLPTVADILTRLRSADDAKSVAVNNREGTRTSKAPMNAKTVQYLRDATEFLRGYYGEASADLTAFGIRPYKVR